MGRFCIEERRWKAVTDILFFLRQGWENILKQRTIWLFSGLNLIIQLILTRTEQEPEGIGILISLASGSLLLILTTIQFIGVPYLAYRFSTGNPASVRDALAAVWKYLGRVIGCSCLVILILSPCLYLFAIFSQAASLQPFRNSNQFFILLLIFSLFGAILDFSLFEFFANDAGVRQALKKSWQLFTANFYVLATLSIGMYVLITVISAVLGVAAMLIQSGFDVDTLRELNYINPSASLEGNILFLLINGIWQTIYQVWSVSVFTLAYLKYSSAANPLVSFQTVPPQS
jgi:hypothetical protein